MLQKEHQKMIKTIIKRALYFGGYMFHHNHKSKIVYYHDIGSAYTNMGTDISLFEKHIKMIMDCGFTY